MTRRLLGVALAIAIGIIVIAVGQAAFQRDWFSPWRTAYLARPDIVEPQVGSVIASGDTYPVTVYEYLDRDNFIVSGRTITYSFSRSYYVDPLPPPGESVLNFGIAFDADTGGSWADAPKDLREPGADISKQQESARRHISASIFLTAPRVARSEELAVSWSRGKVHVNDIPATTTSCSGEYHWTRNEYCGFDMFERCSRGNALARDAQAYPFNTASIFARNGNGGGYTRIIECNQSSALGWCTTKSEHPLNREFVIYFSGQRLCDVEDVVRLASDMFSKHIVAQTPPANGWGVGGPGNQREQPQDRGLNDNVSVK